MEIQIQGKSIDLQSLPHREATEQERRKMLGSLATVYELKVPLLYHPAQGQFYVMDDKLAVTFSDEVELIVLQTDVVLPSIFRKPVKRKRNKKWQ